MLWIENLTNKITKKDKLWTKYVFGNLTHLALVLTFLRKASLCFNYQMFKVSLNSAYF